MTPFHSPRQIERMRRDYPGLPFQFHASDTFRAFWSARQLHRYHAICHESRWISIHLAITPAWAVFTALRLGIRLPALSSEKGVKRLIEKIRGLKRKTTLPVILENMPVSAVLGNHDESNPRLIRDVMMKTGCQMLLDLAHARVAADFHGLQVREYIQALPLSAVRQIHISGVRRKEGQLFDAHETLQAFDYELLAWVLNRTKPEALTLEYFLDDWDALREMLSRLHEVLARHP